MSLRQKIIGAAARWAGSSAAPQWARQAACGFHSTGAASAAAGAPGASPRGLLLSSPNVSRPDDRSVAGCSRPSAGSATRVAPRLLSVVPYACFLRDCIVPTPRCPLDRAREILPTPPFRRKYLAPPSDLKFDLPPRQARALTPSSTTSTMPSSSVRVVRVFAPPSACPSTVSRRRASPSSSPRVRTR